jgi:methionyl-tRNA formyltransferase
MYEIPAVPRPNNHSLRGAAPIHRALLLGRPYTGVSVQTLHPTKFDHGRIIAQSPLPGIPISPGATPRDLDTVLSAEGARLLQQVIQSRSFVDPAPVSHSREALRVATGGKELAKAPKVTKEDSRVDWHRMSAAEILLRLRVFGKVWDDVLYKQLGGLQSESRVVYQNLGAVPASDSTPPGTPFLVDGSDTPGIAIQTCDGAIQVVDCTISGGKSTGGAGVRELVRLLSRQ